MSAVELVRLKINSAEKQQLTKHELPIYLPTFVVLYFEMAGGWHNRAHFAARGTNIEGVTMQEALVIHPEDSESRSPVIASTRSVIA